MRFLHLSFVSTCLVVLAGCSNTFSPGPIRCPECGRPLTTNDSPQGAMVRFVESYERKMEAEYQGMFTGDFTFEFSSSTDPSLVQQYSTGWFKNDERESSAHLFAGYTPPGGQTLEPASTIDINLAITTPQDDNTIGLSPKTYKILATRVDGGVVVPQSGADAIRYAIVNNFDVFYVVRGDAAVNLDSTQPADSLHWYIYRWVDLTAKGDSSSQSDTVTWGGLKGRYH
jgi:hypothetical protein